MSKRASVQTARLSLETIEDEVVLLARGQYRAVLEVSGVHFGLRGDAEQEAIVGGFAAFLNSLSFPAQVLVRVLPIDIDGYIGDLERRARHELSEELAALARDHVAFVRRLARNRTLLERHFYLVIPADTESTGSRGAWSMVRRRTGRDSAAARKQLVIRCEEVERQFLLAAAKGEGLFFARSSHVAIKVEASPAEHRLVTTAPRELAERSVATTGTEAAEADRSLRPLAARRRLGSTGAAR